MRKDELRHQTQQGSNLTQLLEQVINPLSLHCFIDKREIHWFSEHLQCATSLHLICEEVTPLFNLHNSLRQTLSGRRTSGSTGFKEVPQHYLSSVDFNSDKRFSTAYKNGKISCHKIMYSGTSLGIQWLGLGAHDAGGQIPPLVGKPPQLKDPIHRS